MQCSGSPYAACLNGKCDCIPGYITENSSHCVLGMFFLFSLFLRRGRGCDFYALFIPMLTYIQCIFFIDMKRHKCSLQCFSLFIYIRQLAIRSVSRTKILHTCTCISITNPSTGFVKHCLNIICTSVHIRT